MDPDQINHFGGMAAGFIAFLGIIILVFVVFYIFLFWRICTKAGPTPNYPPPPAPPPQL
jgi:hypothetical protein